METSKLGKFFDFLIFWGFKGGLWEFVVESDGEFQN
jgi:hypothetical protein